jgi:hypothetical protein
MITEASPMIVELAAWRRHTHVITHPGRGPLPPAKASTEALCRNGHVRIWLSRERWSFLRSSWPDRLFAKIDKRPDSCWMWTASQRGDV